VAEQLPLLRRPKRKRRRKRRFAHTSQFMNPHLISSLSKMQEESDDDMGFGLFD